MIHWLNLSVDASISHWCLVLLIYTSYLVSELYARKGFKVLAFGCTSVGRSCSIHLILSFDLKSQLWSSRLKTPNHIKCMQCFLFEGRPSADELAALLWDMEAVCGGFREQAVVTSFCWLHPLLPLLPDRCDRLSEALYGKLLPGGPIVNSKLKPLVLAYPWTWLLLAHCFHEVHWGLPAINCLTWITLAKDTILYYRSSVDGTNSHSFHWKLHQKNKTTSLFLVFFCV